MASESLSSFKVGRLSGRGWSEPDAKVDVNRFMPENGAGLGFLCIIHSLRARALDAACIQQRLRAEDKRSIDASL